MLNYEFMRMMRNKAMRNYEYMRIMRKNIKRVFNSQHSRGYSPACAKASAGRHFSHRAKGFALLFAILASGVLLSIGAAIWNIAFKEVLLSSFGRESQSAFYVADTAIECAFYHDFIGEDVFATSTDSISPSFWDNYKSINCAGLIINVGIYHPSGLYQIDSRNATSTFSIDVGSGKAIVVIGKSDPDGDGRSATNIVSHGQNSRNSFDQTIVERGLRANY